jgi:hypothetical protein
MVLALLLAATVGLLTDMRFDQPAPLASSTQIMDRVLSPLSAARIKRNLQSTGGTLAEQSLDLTQETFTLYVPANAPPEGYGLLVFVPPWDDARLPDGWAAMLDRTGTIFVSFAKSGNDASVLGRRIPLALTAEANVAHRYPLNPARIYIGGFSGGAHVAERIALAYPDVFHGALLDAGSDPLGAGVPAVPPKDLFYRFQETTRLAYVTGGQDVVRLGMASVSRQSMQDWCATNIDSETIPQLGHGIATSAALSWALDALSRPPASNDLTACRAKIDADMGAMLQHARSLLADGKTGEAQDLLTTIDRRFGGLAGPQSVEIDARLH